MLNYKIKEIIKKYFTQGKADKLKTDGFEEIKNLIRREGELIKDYKPALNKMVKEVEEQLLKEFQGGYGTNVNSIIKTQLNSVIDRTKKEFEDNAKKAQEIIQNSLTEDALKGKDWETTARRALEKLEIEEHHIDTEIETAKAALNNLKRFTDFKEAGENLLLRYEGPATERAFCAEHLNKTYTIKEVEEMINDFGQPAFAYSGGYNCRHRWVPVVAV